MSHVRALRTRRPGFDAVDGLTVYLGLALLVPASLTIVGLNSYGRPSMLWGLLLLFWWLLDHLHRGRPAPARRGKPVRFVFGALVVVALVSYAAAMLRGQPYDQVSPAFSGMLRLAGWAGVLLMAVDGIREIEQIRTLLRRFVWLACVQAAIGVAQFLTGQTLIDRLSIPGLSPSEAAGVQVRGSFVRAIGTTTHPLEYGAVLCMALPVALALAVSFDRGREPGRRPAEGTPAWLARWLPAGFLAGALLLSASRSSILGLIVAVGVVVIGLPSTARKLLLFGGGTLALVVVAGVPGMYRTMEGFFVGASDDPSTLSRTNGLAAAPGFIAASPLFGTGLGTFLPRYYIFDDAWVLVTIELGIVGVVAFGLLLLTSVVSSLRVRWISGELDVAVIGQSLAAAVATAAVVFAGFDGLSFPVSAGLLFLLVGLSGALVGVAHADRALASAPGPVQVVTGAGGGASASPGEPGAADAPPSGLRGRPRRGRYSDLHDVLRHRPHVPLIR